MKNVRGVTTAQVMKVNITNVISVIFFGTCTRYSELRRM